MKIIFNGLLYSKKGAGISNYAKSLMYEYNKLNNLKVDLILNKDVETEFENLEKVSIANINSSIKRILTEQIILIKKFSGSNLVHFPDYSIPKIGKFKKIATVHDLAFITAKEHYTKNQILVKKFLFNQTVKNADKLICISKFTYNELKKYYPNIPDEKIKIIYNGFNKYDLTKVPISTNLNKWKIEAEYILFVGTIAPSKNLIRFLEAFKNNLSLNKNLKFVIVGKKGWGFDEVETKIKDLNIEGNILITGYVTDAELETLYRKCLFVVYPSLYEGFGLPALEALSREKAVLLSDLEVFKETVGEKGALFCNPYSIVDMQEKLKFLIENKNLRNEIVENGKKSIERFSWEKCAKETLELYAEVLRGESI